MHNNKHSTLTEILDYITQSDDIEVRKVSFLEAYNTLDFFKVFIDMCFFDEHKQYSKLTDFVFVTKTSKNVHYVTSPRDVILKYLPKIKDDSGIKEQTRMSLFSSLLEESCFEDIPLLLGMVKGLFVYKNEKINKVFLSKVIETKKLI